MPEITSVTAAVCALLFVAMSADTARLRFQHKVPLQGLGDNKHVNRSMRIHGNFAEYVPLALVQLLLLELWGVPDAALGVIGASLVVARVSHWVGLKTSSGPSIWRTLGVGTTWTVLLVEALVLLGAVGLG